MISMRGVAKAFGDRIALQGVDLDVAEGECLVLVGPNGAGKTTLLRILAGLSKPTGGSVRIAGWELSREAEQFRRQIGFISHHPLLYDDLTAEENLRFYGRMYDVPRLDERIDALLRDVRLEARRDDLVRTHSRGMRQRLSIARALLHNPPILLLDEPYTGLDQQAADTLDTLLGQAGLASRTVVLTTHNLEQGLRLARHGVVLVQGRIRYEMSPASPDPERFREAYRELTATPARSGS